MPTRGLGFVPFSKSFLSTNKNPTVAPVLNGLSHFNNPFNKTINIINCNSCYPRLLRVGSKTANNNRSKLVLNGNLRQFSTADATTGHKHFSSQILKQSSRKSASSTIFTSRYVLPNSNQSSSFLKAPRGVLFSASRFFTCGVESGSESMDLRQLREIGIE